MDNKKITTDNGGYSLIELIVVVLVSSILMGMVMILMASARNTYFVIATDAAIQQESEAVRTFINEIAIESIQHGYAENIDADGDDLIWFLAPDNMSLDKSKYSYYFIMLEPKENGDGVLRYGKFPCNTSVKSEKIRVMTDEHTMHVIGEAGYTFEDLLVTGSTKIKGDDYKLLANHISYITCTTNDGGLVTVTLKLSYNNVQNYTKSFSFSGRNPENKTKKTN